MAHFAELDSTNTVIRILVVANDMVPDEQTGITFLKSLYGQDSVWKQTSYNTLAGIYRDRNTGEPHGDQSRAFRKNYAGIGYSYNEVRDAFSNAKPVVDESVEQYVSFNDFACLWSYNPPAQPPIIIGVARV